MSEVRIYWDLVRAGIYDPTAMGVTVTPNSIIANDFNNLQYATTFSATNAQVGGPTRDFGIYLPTRRIVVPSNFEVKLYCMFVQTETRRLPDYIKLAYTWQDGSIVEQLTPQEPWTEYTKVLNLPTNTPDTGFIAAIFGVPPGYEVAAIIRWLWGADVPK